VLPGIAHLALLEWVLAQLAATAGGPTTGGDAARWQRQAGQTAIRQVHQVRWRRPVAPGDRLQVWVESAGEGAAWRFELRRDAQVVSQGLISCADDAPSPGPPAAGLLDGAAEPADGGFPHPALLLPHGPAAQLLARVVRVSPSAAVGEEGAAGEVEATGIVCHAVIPDDHPLAAGGTAPGVLALEIAAQAAAAWMALRQRRADGGSSGDGGDGAMGAISAMGGNGREPRVGYLVGARDVLLAPRLAAGTPLRIAVTAAGGTAQLGIYRLALDLAGAAAPSGGLATGAISIFVDGR
jgi:predicted hotdog family 3-hydroxylacyl-ACP dehydratase